MASVAKEDKQVFSAKNVAVVGAGVSVGSFFERHFGKEVIDYFINPFVAGTSDGDPESLSVWLTYLWCCSVQIKCQEGSKWGYQGSSVNKKHKHGSFSFVGGMQVDIDHLRLQSQVLELSCNGCEKSQISNWSISYEVDGKTLSFEKSFDALIMTAPLSDVMQMKIRHRESLYPLDFIPEVSYLPLSVIITTFKNKSVKTSLEGFGVLIPSKEQQNGLRTLDRSPKDLYLYTTFVGGSRKPELAKASRDELKQIVTSDLRQLLGAEGEPTFLSHYYWSKVFPLYGYNYDSVHKAIENMERGLPGFFYAGSVSGDAATRSSGLVGEWCQGLAQQAKGATRS